LKTEGLRRRRRVRRHLPRLDYRDIEDDERLDGKIDEVLDADDSQRLRRERILVRQAVWKRRVSEDAWRTFLKLEEATTARWSDALVTILRWAFIEGVEAAKGCRRDRT